MSPTAAVGKDVSYASLLEVAVAAARAGREVVLAGVDKPRNISYKGVTDLVTDVDKATEEAVLKVLRSSFPSHAILGEEGGVSGDTSSEFLWCVDPLDGTTNFAHSYPAFAVSVGVLHHAVPVVGCIIVFSGGPGAWTTRTFSACQGGGATADGRPIHVSSNDNLTRALAVTGFGYEHDEPWAATLELFKLYTDITQGIRRSGAAAVDLCHLASGHVDFYFEFRLKPWDMAAGVIIAQEAGARVTRMDGKPFTVFDRSLLISNGAIHDQVLTETKPVVESLLSQGVDLSQWFVPPGYSTG